MLLRVTECGGIQLAAGSVAAQSHRQIKIRQQIQQDVPHARFAGDGKSPSVKPSEKNSMSSQSDRLKNIRSATNAAIEEYGNLAVHAAYDGREGIQRRDGTVPLTP